MMNKGGTFTTEEEVTSVTESKPHLVILGAGASRAAFPNGERNERSLPLMEDFISTLSLAPLFAKYGYAPINHNIEEVYSDIFEKRPNSSLLLELESSIFSYFAEMALPDEPTIYDHLVLSLRPKDFIATFNWDPFLVQAVKRNGEYAPSPQLIFLHGNVAIGHCMKCKCMGPYDWTCSNCGCSYTRSKLLYPVRKKDYSSPFISSQWNTVQEVLSVASMVHIFGYGAPVSDVQAIKLMKDGWGESKDRKMEQVGMINKLPEEVLYRTWEPFIHSSHYHTTTDFFDSWISKHPRRTIEAYFAQHWEGRFVQENRPPVDVSLMELREWYAVIGRYE